MALADLATVAQLAAFIQEDIAPDDAGAALMLSVASGMVRDYLQQTITAVADDVLLTEPMSAASLVALLPERPVTAVTLLETFDYTTGLWTVADPATYAVSLRLGTISVRTDASYACWPSWPTDPESWRVTYSHGFAEVPDSLVGVVLGVAGRNYSSPIGVDLERLGTYQVKYAIESGGFSKLELIALDRYAEARVA
jgi:hypothetical protein